MPTKSIYSIFKENEKITNKNAKMKHLRENYTPAMGIVLEFTYNAMSSIVREGIIFTSNHFNKQIIGEA